MAARIAGITIEIGGDTTKLVKALSGVDKSIKSTQTALKDIDKLLKLDPTSTELLSQKQKALAESITQTKDRLKALKEASEQAAKTAGNYDAWKEKYDPIQQEIKETYEHLEKLKKTAETAEKQFNEGKISKEKYESVQNEVKETEQRLKDLKEQAKAVSDEFGHPIPPDQYDALQREIIETEQKLDSLQKQYKDFGSVAKQQLEAVGQEIKSIGDKVSKVGEKISSFGNSITSKVTLPITAAATASVAAWNEVDNAMDSLRKMTGATGESLESMEEIVEDIATTLPTSFETVAQAVGEVNTRFGVTGDTLDELATKFIQYAAINNTDVVTSIDSVQGAMAAFDLPANQAGLVLDTLTSISQSTGLSVDYLSDSVTANAATFREMGLGLEDAASLLGQLELNGVEASAAMTGLKKAYAESLKKGTSLIETLTGLETGLKNDETATTAASEAIELFGTRAGGQLVDALKSGRLSFQNLDKSMSDFAGNTQSTFEDTLDPLDSFASIMNEIKLLGADIVKALGPTIQTVLQSLSEVIHKVSGAWNGLAEDQQQMMLKIVGIAAGIGPVISILGRLTSSIGAICSPVGLVVIAITGLIAAGVALYQNWDEIKAWASEVWNNIKETVSGTVKNLKQQLSENWEQIKTDVWEAWDNVKQKISNTWENVKSTVSSKLESIRAIISNGWENVKSGTSETWEDIKNTASAVWNGIKLTISYVWEGIKSAVSSAVTAVENTVSTVFSAVRNTASNIWNGIKSAIQNAIQGAQNVVFNVVYNVQNAVFNAFSNLQNVVYNIWQNIKNAIMSPIQEAYNFVANIVNNIKSVLSGIGSAVGRVVSGVKNAAGNISVPTPIERQVPVAAVPTQWNARAMNNAVILDRATIFGMAGGRMLGGGEAGREVVSGESHLLDMISSAVNNAIGTQAGGILDILKQYLPECAQTKVAVPVDGIDSALDARWARRAAAWQT